jgi:hypothetical protein
MTVFFFNIQGLSPGREKRFEIKEEKKQRTKGNNREGKKAEKEVNGRGRMKREGGKGIEAQFRKF